MRNFFKILSRRFISASVFLYRVLEYLFLFISVNRVIIIKVLFAFFYIYLGEIFKHWSSTQMIKMPRWEKEISMQWFVTFVVSYARPFVILSLALFYRKDPKFIIWVFVILGTYMILEFIYWIKYFEEGRNFWIVIYSTVVIDTLCFRKYWASILIVRLKDLRENEKIRSK